VKVQESLACKKANLTTESKRDLTQGCKSEISGLKLGTDLRLKRIYHCRITDVGEDHNLRIIIHKSIGG
jgi:hypothetical protein